MQAATIIVPPTAELSNLIDITIPDGLEAGCDIANAIGGVGEGTKWWTAAFVFAWTEDPLGSGAHNRKFKSELSAPGFAHLGIRGLHSRNTVAAYRKAWADLPAELRDTAAPGRRPTLPTEDFPVSGSGITGRNHDNEWYTPPRYVEAARELMGGIDLDPASCAEANLTIQATAFYSIEDDGLSQPWRGRVWLNPPWSGAAADFAIRLLVDFRAGDVKAAVVLLNAHATDTAYMQDLLRSGPFCFTDHRIGYASPGKLPSGGSTHGSVFVALGCDTERFDHLFARFGLTAGPGR